MHRAADTIAAIATPAGRGAIGIVRLSGPECSAIAEKIMGRVPAPRRAVLTQFSGADQRPVDTGIALYFAAPASYTGEDMLELQCHGGAVVTGLLLRRVLELGARPARPGEFTERAFLNGRLDLLQAEAVADLIDSQTERAARCAARALEGEFSRRVESLQQELTTLRVQAEAALDFPEEELGLAGRRQMLAGTEAWLASLQCLRASARAGHALRQGLCIVITGAANVGKSSLLNRLVGSDRAIVDDTPGTTRDIVEGDMELGGMRARIMDTAGVRAADDAVEREGIRRTVAALQQADVVLVVSEQDGEPVAPSLLPHLEGVRRRILVRNKIDRDGTAPASRELDSGWEVALSARTGAGVDLLLQALARVAGDEDGAEDVLLARTRHLHALEECFAAALRAAAALRDGAGAELVAEDLRVAQTALGRITGTLDADDLLGEIFAHFCIGK